MDNLSQIKEKKNKLAIGLMSGTSIDGIDAVLVEIGGSGVQTKVRQIAFITLPFKAAIRERLLQVVTGEFGGSKEVGQLKFLLGELFTKACLEVCKVAGVSPREIAFVGSHGQTVFHQTDLVNYLGKQVCSTLQIGEASVIAEQLGCMVVSDFRVRDMAAGGLGAPLVPYTEYLLYRDTMRTIALQNIGGIGNITLIPKSGGLEDLVAFDTGPGNMVIDALARIATKGRLQYDKGGQIAATGKVSPLLLDFMLEDEYLTRIPPKTTGREKYGNGYVKRICEKGEALGLIMPDIMATATYFTAKTIEIGIEQFCKDRPECLIVGGGGSQNPLLMRYIGDCLPDLEVLTQETVGYDSHAKEAIAFAVLANETIYGLPIMLPKQRGQNILLSWGKLAFSREK